MIVNVGMTGLQHRGVHVGMTGLQPGGVPVNGGNRTASRQLRRWQTSYHAPIYRFVN